MRCAVAVVIAFACCAALAADPVQRTLSFDDRVKAQAAIERVYYAHQLGATKPFDDAMPKAVLEAKVRKYLDQTAALNVYWKTAVTDEMLQREWERMAQATKMPERLLELYAALGDDPFIFEECVARATLVDRLTHNFYAFDSTLHVKTREQAELLHRQLVSGELSPLAAHANRTVLQLVVAEDIAAPDRSEDRLQKRLTLEEFQKRRTELPVQIGQVSEVEESRDAFAFNVVLTETATDARVASYVVPKRPWDAWWAGAQNTVQAAPVAAVASDRGPLNSQMSSGSAPAGTSSGSTCTPDDTWVTGSLAGSPDKRSGHTAIWTGSVMVVWGGSVGSGVGTGGRYDPATDTWSATSTVGAPSDRSGHTAVWTGSLMVVWGGDNVGPKTGGRYDALTDTWRPTSTTGAPTLGLGHSAVWTGSLMVVWGGESDAGGRYDPVSDTWTPTSTTGAPSARSGHTAVWTGSLMVVWSGDDANGGSTLYTGGRYDPVADSWQPTSTTGTPNECENTRAAAWTGNLMLLWCTSFHSGEVVTSGARYDPLDDAWTPMSTIGGYGARAYSSAVWTGTQLVIWGGQGRTRNTRNTGARYDPVQDAWTQMAAGTEARQEHSAIWTGTLMIIWGGNTGPRDFSHQLNTGGRYDPLTNSWTPTSTDPPNAPAARKYHTAVWTGNLMVVWGGGSDSGGELDSGGRYDPATDSWTPTSITNAPAGRAFHTGVWTGNELLVWGGYGGESEEGEIHLNTGARYDPMADHWTPISLTGAPTRRRGNTAIWTGSVMVVWGGFGDQLDGLDTGGRYDPATDTWTPTSTDPSNAPSARYGHSAVWTGSRMVVWGGDYSLSDGPDGSLSSGGRYDPITDSWTPTSNINAPMPRNSHSAVWTGGSMVVWGGAGPDYVPFDTGAVYDPSNDSWTPTATTSAPYARYGHTAVWTGSVMVIWGEADERTGGRYDPATDTWTPTSVDGAPSQRWGHSAVWTGTEMIVWGGDDGDHALGNGGRYGVVISPTVDRDCDGLSASEGDCDDTRGSVYPGAPQICDGRNNDCNDPAWPVVPSNEVNSDGDAFLLCAGDCDDTNSDVYPGAYESCNGLDDDCDGVIDGNAAIFCNDGNPCTDDSCEGAAGCVWVPNGHACDDSISCTTGDICSGGTCSGTWIECDDGNSCTDDYCANNSGCHNVPSTNPCDDGNPCTGGDVCSQGVCNAGIFDGCDDGNPCTDDSCDSSRSCVHEDILGLCDDGNECTIGDICFAGSCWPGEGVLPCDDHNVCTTDSCNPKIGCVFGDISTSCDDGNACTDDSCDPVTGCASINADNACTDGNLCTAGDYCIDGACIPGPPLICHDNNACTDDLCYPAMGCYFATNTNPCSDGNACTKGDFCEYGACQAGAPAICNDFNPCTTDSCDHIVGCVFANHTFPCDDQSVCTTGDACRGGRCEGTSVNCDDANPCTNDSCHPATGCFHTNNTNACDDGNLCTTSDKCGGGECRGTISDPKPKSSGYYKTLCEMRAHNQLADQGDQLTDADAICVGELTATFAGIATTDDICDVIYEDHHGGPGGPSNGQDCSKGEDELIATALNICRGRVCEGQSLNSRCKGNAHTTVGRSFADADAILDDVARTQDTCRRATCELREINNGQALEIGKETP